MRESPRIGNKGHVLGDAVELGVELEQCPPEHLEVGRLGRVGHVEILGDARGPVQDGGEAANDDEVDAVRHQHARAGRRDGSPASQPSLAVPETSRRMLSCATWWARSRSAGVICRWRSSWGRSTLEGCGAARSSRPCPAARRARRRLATVGLAPGRSSRATAAWLVPEALRRAAPGSDRPYASIAEGCGRLGHDLTIRQR